MIRLVLSGLVFYRRSHLGVLFGTMLAAAVLTGSLLVGDSVDGSLRRFALQRLGDIQYAMHLPDRLFDRSLADRMGDDCGAALLLRGMAITDEHQVNRVQVIDGDTSFFKVAGLALELKPFEVALNKKLAAALEVSVGDEVSLRVERPGLLPSEAPLSAQNTDRTGRGRFKVVRILGDDELGRFGLAANQVVPYNAFVQFQWTDDDDSIEDKANLLIGSGEDPTATLSRVWNPADFGFRFREELGQVQLESDAVYLGPEGARAALSIPGGEGSLTYLVNSISCGERSTPYSFVLACDGAGGTPAVRLGDGAGGTPAVQLGDGAGGTPAVRPGAVRPEDNEIVINRWLADELDAGVGDRVQLKYAELMTGQRFVERDRSFQVAKIVEMDALELERKLAPRFPGLTDVDRCADWDVGIPMEEAPLEDEANEAYWNTYRQTPKAVVSLKAGQDMWGNRFGNLTGVRWAAHDIPSHFRAAYDPYAAGYRFLPVREQALTAVDEAMDFGQLFVGMSFFLIIAALMLTGLLFIFGVQKRAEEMGILLASGWRISRVRNLFLIEGGCIALVGSVCGGLLGIVYTYLLLLGLSNYWNGAVANSALQLFVQPSSLITGIVASFICAVLAMGLAVRRQSKSPARELLLADFSQSVNVPRSKPRRWGRLVAPATAMLAFGIAVYAMMAELQSVTMPFFSAGGLLLISGVLFCNRLFDRENFHGVLKHPVGLALRNISRRKGRSLAVAGLLSCGCFLVFSVSSMKEDLVSHAGESWSGTGGFEWFAESTLPLSEIQGAVNLRVLDGDDASCLNLNRARRPRLLGVDPNAMSARHAFFKDEDVWTLLKMDLPEGVVPALVGDSDTAMWGLEAAVGPEKGDVLEYTDEAGRTFKVKLVGALPMRLSVFQGTLLIAENQFVERFPSESGYRMFLLNDRVEGRTYERAGFDSMRSVERLLEFYAVESTYLAMFLVLGFFGLLIGSVGVGIVVLRNVLDRRAELSVLKALGYRADQLRMLLFMEHSILTIAGLAVGLVSAAVAMIPAVFLSGSTVSAGFMAGLFLLVLFCCLISLGTAVLFSLKGEMLDGLRNE